MANRELTITPAQQQSSDRHDLREAIYLLSGTLTGRDDVPDATFYWATRSITALGQQFKAFLAPPQRVMRGMGFEPGSQGSFPEVQIPVRNLPFAHSESTVAAITDDDFRVENTTATLRVAYLRPGQTEADLVNADWTPLVLDGFLGPPSEVTLDGFVLPLYNRGARRNQSLYWPQLPSPETMSGGAIDEKDSGTMPPVVVGCPQDWIRMPSLNLGVRGFSVSGFSAGDTVVTFRTITIGPERLTSGNLPVGADAVMSGFNDPPSTGHAGLQVHYLFPVYEVVSASFDAQSREFTVQLHSGLAADIPRGAYVQQFGPGVNPANGFSNINGGSIGSDATVWTWSMGNEMFGGVDDGGSFDVRFGWLFADGEVRPFADGRRLWLPVAGQDLFNKDVYPWDIGTRDSADLFAYGGKSLGARTTGGTLATIVALERGTRNDPSAPVYFDPLGGTNAEVQTQPEFTSQQAALGAINRPTGGTGTDNSNMRDGADTTGGVVNTGNTVTLTFEAAPAPFANEDTTRSVLHALVGACTGGGVNFTNAAGSTTFASAISAPGTYAITQTSPRDFDATIRIVNNAGGSATILEVWWEHDLSATVQNTRTQDVTLVSSTVALGPEMQYADLVVRYPRGAQLHGQQFNAAGSFATQPSGSFRINETVTGSGFPKTGDTTRSPVLVPVSGSYFAPFPTSVMIGLHVLLGNQEGRRTRIDESSYASSHAKFVADNIRLGLVWTNDDRPDSWSEIEAALGEQSRSFMFYGPSGHQILYLESASGFEALPVKQEFRLPGCPGSNVTSTNQALFERTLTTELINIVDVLWDRDVLKDAYRRSVRAVNAESIADIGERLSDRGALRFYAHSPWDGNPLFNVSGVVSGIAEFYADRQAFAATRFNFKTAWIAHGLDRGSLIRVTYPVSSNPASFRNVVAEVEEVAVSPIDSEQFEVRARSITKPQKGLSPAFIWTDVFTAESDVWTTRILQVFDTWSDHWSTP